MNLQETYNQIAEDWHQDHSGDDWWIEETEAFAALLRPGSRVLDAGCGGGTKTKYLTEKGFLVTGVDFSENLLAIAKREVPDARFQLLDLREIERLEEKFDGIFMQAVLLHFSKDEAANILQKIVSRLNPGGILYVSVKEKREGQTADEEVVKENDYGYEYERFFSYYSLREVQEYFEKNGLEILSSGVSYSGKTGWIQVTGKK